MRESLANPRYLASAGTGQATGRALLLSIAVVFAGCIDSSGDSSGTSDASVASGEWQRYHPTPVFSFLAPADLERTEAQPVDSVAGVYRSPELEINFDYGWYADPLGEGTREMQSREHVTIGGRQAVLVEYDAGAAAHFPNVSGDNHLTMTIRWSEPNTAAMGMEILRSITFE